MPVKVTKLGPGTITLGEVATVLDFSCQLISAQVEWSKDKDDDVTTLCGDTVAGAATYTAQLTGSLYQDLDAAGIVAYSYAHKGETVPFTYTPNTTSGATVDGFLTVDPITVGGDEMKKNMQSDFTWDCVGEPEFTPSTGGATAVTGIEETEPVS